MEKFPFSQTGFEALRAKLYALPNPLLHAKAEEIRVDFPAFILDSFELEPPQIVFFSNLHADTIYFMASTVSLALRNRLPINLIKEEKPANRSAGDPPIYKIVRDEMDVAMSENSEGETEVEGTVDIIITYP
jgi:hypothetical protein